MKRKGAFILVSLEDLTTRYVRVPMPFNFLADWHGGNIPATEIKDNSIDDVCRALAEQIKATKKKRKEPRT